MQHQRKKRITKKEFYDLGGFANSDLFRLQTRGGSWRYYINLERAYAGCVTGKVTVCQHNYIRLPGASLGCVTYRCTHCGDEYERDIS